MGYGNGGGAVDMGPLGGAVMGKQATRQTAGDELTAQEKQLNDLNEVINALEQRLSPILSPSAPATENAGGHPMPSASAVVECLRRNGYKLDAAITHIADLLQRIEL